MANTRHNVTARGLHNHALAFSEAAEAVHTIGQSDPLPKYFLWGRTIELVLKSFLLVGGRSITELRSRKFGHNLVALMKDADAKGLSALIGREAVHRSVVHLLDLEYATKRLEYRDSGGEYRLPTVTLTRQVIQRLLRGVDFHLKKRHGI
ncbi:MAG: hypothetical protein MN733_41675 [Nitrososphaera sp.]|nr:hypothetical protein [Nitrososphaera sp.]